MIQRLSRMAGMSAVFFLASGCAVQKPMEWSAIGGSRSDATVTMAYGYKFGAPKPNIDQAILLARSRCQSWGYTNAESFAGESKVCKGHTEPTLLGHNHCFGEWVIAKDFQCTGQGTETKAAGDCSQAANSNMTYLRPAPKSAKKKKSK